MDTRTTSIAIAGLLSAHALTSACNHSQTGPASPTVITLPGATVSGSSSTRTIDGRIESVQPPNAIVVSGNRVVVDSGSAIRSGSMALSFDDLRVGANTHVTAAFDGTTNRALEVNVTDAVGAPTSERGVITGVSVNGNAFEFRVGNRLVRGDGDTRVMDGSNAAPPAYLRDGVIADVSGLQRADYLYATGVNMEPYRAPGTSPSPSPSPEPSPSPSPSPTPGPVGPVTVSGTVGNVIGACPLIVFTANGNLVATADSTAWNGGVCASLAPGATVDVSGSRNGSTLIARNINIR